MGRFRDEEHRVASRTKDAINRVPTSHAINCARNMIYRVSAMSSTLSHPQMAGERRMKSPHILCAKRQFIASKVGTQFIASASPASGNCQAVA
jgi:hypothetical protein